MSKSVVEQIEEAIVEGRKVTRELHAATKDLKAAMKEARELREAIHQDIEDHFDRMINETVGRASSEIEQWQIRATKQIMIWFDDAFRPLMAGLAKTRQAMIDKVRIDVPPLPKLPELPEANFTGGEFVLPRLCPYCRSENDAFTGHEDTPKTGDYSICFTCARVAVFTETGIRKPTEEEQSRLDGDLSVQRLIATAKAAIS